MNLKKEKKYMEEKGKAWGWSYAVIREKKSSGRWDEYVLKEIYGEKSPDSWTQDGIGFSGDTPEEIVIALKMAIRDIENGLVLDVKGKKLVKSK